MTLIGMVLTRNRLITDVIDSMWRHNQAVQLNQTPKHLQKGKCKNKNPISLIAEATQVSIININEHLYTASSLT
jgi:hypothetical protein